MLPFKVIALGVLGVALFASGCAGLRKGGISTEALLADSLAREEAMDHYLSGSIHEESSELYPAAVEYQMAWLADPSSISIPVRLARIYARLGEMDAAKRVLESASKQHPRDPEILKALAEVSLRSGDLTGSTEYYKRLSKVKPLDAGEMLRQILMLEKSRRTDEALRLSKDYLLRFPPDPAIYERIGLIHISRQDFEAADTAFRRLLELDPKNHRIQFVVGGFCVARSDFAEAEGFFRKAVELDSSETRYWSNLLMVVGEQRKEEELAELLAQAIEAIPDYAPFYDIRAGAAERKGDLEAAKENAEKSIALDSARVSPYLTLGYVYHQSKEWEKSAEAYDMALALDAENPLVLNNYAYMLSVQGVRLDEALQMVETALRISPETPSYRDTRGWILHRLGRNDEALVEVEAALKLDQENAELYQHIGFIYKALGRDADASLAWKRAAELAPDNLEYQRLAR